MISKREADLTGPRADGKNSGKVKVSPEPVVTVQQNIIMTISKEILLRVIKRVSRI